MSENVKASNIAINADLVIGVLRQKLSDRDYENALLTARNSELEMKLKETLEAKIAEVDKQTEALKEGVKGNGNK